MSASPVLVQLPHWNWMPRSGQSYTEPGWIALPAATNDSTVDGSTIVTFTVPPGMNGVVDRIAMQFIGAGFTDGSGSLIWRILQNGQAVPNYGAILGSLGSVSNPQQIAPIILVEGDVVELTIDNVNLPGGAGEVTGLLGGWFYPKELDDSLQGDYF